MSWIGLDLQDSSPRPFILSIVIHCNLCPFGDCNTDGNLDIADPICLLNAIFVGIKPGCEGPLTGDPAPLDWDGSGDLNVTDAIGTLNFLFLGGPTHTLVGPGDDPFESSIPCCLAR